ncbi:MAG TPA: hypothetical protein VMB47_00560 [Candidatus Aquilonibacter sp.]|nr:hypothetical protein [Candidatus Aquilonibacter sp.]
MSQIINTPFWWRGDFWIATVIGIVGALIAFGAWRQAGRAEAEAKKAKDEAEKAKDAATEAGKTVKLQTVCIDLTEIAQKIAVIELEITFEEAVYLLSDTSRHLYRVMASVPEEDFREAIASVKTALQNAQTSLKEVTPTGVESSPSAGLHSVYYNMVDKFAAINNCVSQLTGLMESKTYDYGRRDAER